MFGLGLTSYIPYLVYFTAIFCILIALIKPKVSLYFLIALLPLSIMLKRMEPFPMGKDINDLLFIAIIAGWFLHIRDKQGKVLTYSPLNRYIFILIIFSFLSYVVGTVYWGQGNPFDFINYRFIHWKNFVMLPILYLMAVNLVKTKKEISLVIFIMVIILFLADMHFYADMEGRNLSMYRKDLRQGGIFPDLGANELAAFHAHFIFIPLALLFYEKRKFFKIMYLSVFLFTLYPILFLFSRGAYFATFTGLLFLGIKKSKVLVVCLVLLMVSWVTILPSAVVERINMTETETGLDHSSSKRLEYWQLGIAQFMRNPVIGVGFDTSQFFRGGDLHNEYVEILAEQGIIGLWVFLSLLFLSFSNGLWLHKNARDDFSKGLGLAVCAVVIACLVTNFFGDRWTYMELSAFLFVLMAITCNSKALVLSERSSR